ncbi:hypothetical protein HD554DRAFT_2202858 [Boletus coccyginus]|nr:hypothetical protein HD554DRAFT_2202858 [Boletus coccyginus]
MSNTSLPQEMLDQEFNVHFVTSSPHASPMKLMHVMKKHAAESGVITWDCRDQEEVLLIPNALFHAGNNSMQAELCSQVGLNYNFFCHTCHIGGTKEYKGSNSGFCIIFEPGLLWTPAEILSNAVLPDVTERIKKAILMTGVWDTLSSTILHTLIEMEKRLCKCRTSMNESNMRKELENELATLLNGHYLKDIINPLLGMPDINIHLDTPTEILYIVLLSVVKYFWGQTIFLIKKAKLLDIFHSGLDSIKRDALNAPSLDANYMCSYKGLLIGKHFKKLIILLWYTKITNLKVYLIWPHDCLFNGMI